MINNEGDLPTAPRLDGQDSSAPWGRDKCLQLGIVELRQQSLAFLGDLGREFRRWFGAENLVDAGRILVGAEKSRLPQHLAAAAFGAILVAQIRFLPLGQPSR